MKLLLLLQVSIVLSQTFEGELVGESDEVRVGDVLLLELFDLLGIRRTVHEDLLLFLHDVNDFLDNDLEVNRKQFVDFIEHKQVTLVEVRDVFGSQVQNTAWGRDDHVYSLLQTVEVLSYEGATGRDHALDFLMFAQVFYDQ